MKTYFSKHFNHLKFHLILALTIFINIFIICYWYSNECLYLLIKNIIINKKFNYFILTDIPEIFYIKILISFYVSVLLSLLINCLNFWIFLAPGLYKKENYFILKFLFIYFIFFFFFNILSITKLIPYIVNFLLEFENNSNNFLYNIYIEPKLSNYLNISIKFLLIINIFIQYPFFILVLLFLKIIKLNNLIKNRKLIYFQILILSLLITPPEFWTQFIINFILIFLLEFIIFVYCIF